MGMRSSGPLLTLLWLVSSAGSQQPAAASAAAEPQGDRPHAGPGVGPDGQPFVCSCGALQNRAQVQADGVLRFFREVENDLQRTASLLELQEHDLAEGVARPCADESIERVCGGSCQSEDRFWRDAPDRTVQELRAHRTGYWVVKSPQRRSEVYFPAWSEHYELDWAKAPSDPRLSAAAMLRGTVKPRDGKNLTALCIQQGLGFCLGKMEVRGDSCPSWCRRPQDFGNNWLSYEPRLSCGFVTSARAQRARAAHPHSVGLWYWAGVSGHLRTIPPLYEHLGRGVDAGVFGPDFMFPVVFAGPKDNPNRTTVWTSYTGSMGNPRIAAAHPVYVGDRWLGAMVAEVNVRKVSALMEPLYATNSSATLLADVSGTVVVSSERANSFLFCPGRHECGGPGNATFAMRQVQIDVGGLANHNKELQTGLGLYDSRLPEFREGGPVLQALARREDGWLALKLDGVPHHVAWTTLRSSAFHRAARLIVLAPSEEIRSAALPVVEPSWIVLGEQEGGVELSNRGKFPWEWHVAMPSPGLVWVEPTSGTLYSGQSTTLTVRRLTLNQSMELRIRSSGVYGACFAPKKILLQVACRPGEYRFGSIGSDSCLPCPRGHHCRAATMTRCAPGSYQDVEGQVVCHSCERGRFAEEEGMSACEDCSGDGRPLTTLLRGSQQREACVCDSSHFRAPGAAECVACSEGMVCDAGRAYPLQAANYFVSASENNAFHVYRCAEGHCLAGEPGLCAAGRTGLACAECECGHYPSRGSSCDPCKDVSSWYTIIVVIVLLVALVLLVLYSTLDVATQHHWWQTLLCCGAQLVSTLQVLAMLDTLRIRRVEPLASVFVAASFVGVGFEALRLQCFIGCLGRLASFIVSLVAIPVLCSVHALVFALLALLMLRRWRYVVDDFVSSLGFLINIFFLPVTLRCLEPFRCQSNPTGMYTLASMPSVLCGSSDHASMIPPAVLGLLFYPMPLFCGTAFLARIFPKLVSAGGGTMLMRRFRFLFQRFTPQCYYYALLYLTRSSLAALPVLVFRGGGPAPLFALSVLVVAFGSLQCWLRPWRTWLANLTDAALALGLLVVFGASTALTMASRETLEAEVSGFAWCTIAMAVVAAVVFLTHCGYKAWRRKHRFDFYLSHHRGNSARLARLLKCLLQDNCHVQTFLDCDELEDPDRRLDVVRCEVRRVAVLLTADALRHVWCAGELATAHKNNVPIITLSHGGHHHGHGPDAGLLQELGIDPGDLLASLDSLWSTWELVPLATVGIKVTDIAACYHQLLEVTKPILIPAALHSNKALRDMDEAAAVVAKLVGKGHRELDDWLFGGYSSEKAHLRVLLLADVDDFEAAAGAAVLARFVSKQTQWETSLLFSERQTGSVNPPSVLLVMLTGGCLVSTNYIKLLHLAWKRWPSMPMVGVRADANFHFPDHNEVWSLTALPATHLGMSREECRRCFTAVLNLLALPFSPHLHISLLETETAMICRRCTISMAKPNAGHDEATMAHISGSDAGSRSASLRLRAKRFVAKAKSGMTPQLSLTTASPLSGGSLTDVQGLQFFEEDEDAESEDDESEDSCEDDENESEQSSEPAPYGAPCGPPPMAHRIVSLGDPTSTGVACSMQATLPLASRIVRLGEYALEDLANTGQCAPSRGLQLQAGADGIMSV